MTEQEIMGDENSARIMLAISLVKDDTVGRGMAEELIRMVEHIRGLEGRIRVLEGAMELEPVTLEYLVKNLGGGKK